MSFRAFLRRCLLEYFVITTCITAVTAVLGLVLEPTAKFGYEAFFSPLIFGLVSLIPSLVTYSSKELSLRQTLIRKALHLIVLETTLVIFGFWAGGLRGADVALFALTVSVVYLLVNIISWALDGKAAAEINMALKSLQDTAERPDA